MADLPHSTPLLTCEATLNQRAHGDLNVSPDFFVPFDKYKPESTYYDHVKSVLPVLWRLKQEYFWTHVVPPLQWQMTQGWKIHVSCMLENADFVLTTLTRICASHSTQFKFASDELIHRKLLSKVAARQAGGKFATIYPRSIETFECMLEELYQALGDIRGPYILSDRQYKDSGAVFYRYGGFQALSSQGAMGETKSMILDSSFQVIEDQRRPYFHVPNFVEDKHWGQNQDKAISSSGDDSLFDGQYEIESVLKFSNAGGVYAGRRVTDGLSVVIKEARPLIIAEVHGIDAFSRLEKERRILEALEGTGIAPRALGWFMEWEHAFLVEEKIEGQTLRAYCVHALKILYPGSGQEEVQEWIRRSAAIGANLIEKVRQLHQRSIVFGDISTNNIIIVPETHELYFIDFEGACQKGLDEASHITTPGFRSKNRRELGDVEFGDDVYAIGCVLLSLISPCSMALDLLDQYPERVLEALQHDIRLPAEFAECIIMLLRQPEPDLEKCIRLLRTLDVSGVQAYTVVPREPEFRDLEHAVSESVRYLRDAMKLDHSWSPFPLGTQSSDLIAVDHGVSGIAWAWHQIEGRLPEELHAWMARAGSEGTHLPGLLNGLCGAAWVQCELGLTAEAKRSLKRAIDHDLLYRNMSLGYGYAGYGLTCLKLWHATEDNVLLHEAMQVGDALIATAAPRETGVAWDVNDDGIAGVGLFGGGSGIALFLLFLYCATEDSRYLESALSGLDHDISCGRTTGGLVGFPVNTDPESTILYPYLSTGSAGVATVALRAYAITGLEKYRRFLDEVKPAVAQKYTLNCDLFMGLAGLGHYLLDAAQFLHDQSYRNLAWRVAKGLELFEVARPSGLCFPASNSTKISCSFAAGGAGVVSYLDRLLNNKGNGMFMLDELLPGTKNIMACGSSNAAIS